MEAIINRLTAAVARDDLKEVLAHLSKLRIPTEQLTVGSWLSKTGRRQYPLLHYAAREGSVKVLRYLVEEKGLDPNQYAAPVGTALSRAVHSEKEECVRYLLTTTCDVNTTVPVCQVRECRMNYVTPIMIALSRNSVENVRLLLDSPNIDVNKTTTFNESALCFAIKHPSLSSEYVSMLLRAGIDANIKSTTDVPPLHMAFKLGRCSVIKQLIQIGCDVNVKQETPGAFGYSALHLAVEMNDCEIVRLLLYAGANLEARSDPNATLGCTPLLHCVAGNRSYQVMSVLLFAGADVTAKDKFGRGIIHWLVLNGDDAPLSFVLSSFKNIDIDLVALDGMPTTPIDYAVMTNNLPALKILLSFNARYIETTDTRETKLDAALKKGVSPEIIMSLYKAGYNFRCATSKVIDVDNGNGFGISASLRHNLNFMNWLKSVISRPRSLQEICRLNIRRQHTQDICKDAGTLPIPTVMQKFIIDIDV